MTIIVSKLTGGYLMEEEEEIITIIIHFEYESRNTFYVNIGVLLFCDIPRVFYLLIFILLRCI